MIELEKIFIQHKPDLVMVLGDINSTMAGALSAAKLFIPVAHVEAGLRSFDNSMPEEINRIVTDSISEYLFTTCEDANKNLINEGHPENNIIFVGNVMIDSLHAVTKKSINSKILDRLGLSKNGQVKPYGVLTLHRPSNVDKRESLKEIFDAITVISEKIPIIFSVHPRTRKRIIEFDFEYYFITKMDTKFQFPRNLEQQNVFSKNGIMHIPPQGILDFSALISKARLVLTDSGGITEETTILKIPCLTLRDNTERPITIKEGTNILVGNNRNTIIEGANEQLNKNFDNIRIPKYWDGKASERIADALLQIYSLKYSN